jgi:predicted nucleic acid-binding protein
MDIVADASAFLAVALEEPKQKFIVDKTVGCGLISPDVLPYEIGNALIAGSRRKQHQLSAHDVQTAFSRSQRITVRLVPVRIDAALKLAHKLKIYAYDAYYLQCALETGLPLLTLDRGMMDCAKSLHIEVLE